MVEEIGRRGEGGRGPVLHMSISSADGFRQRQVTHISARWQKIFAIKIVSKIAALFFAGFFGLQTYPSAVSIDRAGSGGMTAAIARRRQFYIFFFFFFFFFLRTFGIAVVEVSLCCAFLVPIGARTVGNDIPVRSSKSLQLVRLVVQFSRPRSDLPYPVRKSSAGPCPGSVVFGGRSPPPPTFFLCGPLESTKNKTGFGRGFAYFYLFF